MRKTAAFAGKTRPVFGVVHVRQPQHDRAQPALTLGRTVAGDPIAGGCGGVHVLHVTHERGLFKQPFAPQSVSMPSPGRRTGTPRHTEDTIAESKQPLRPEEFRLFRCRHPLCLCRPRRALCYRAVP